MTTTPIVFLDTETDGVHPGRKVWEVAMIRRDEDGERETSFFVEIDLSTADPFGLKVGRFYDRHPMGRVLAELDEHQWDSEVDYYPEYRAALAVARWTHGAHIVGMVPNFDTEVLANLLRAQQLTPAWHYHLIDVENMILGYIARERHDEEIFLFNTTDEVRNVRGTSVLDRRTAMLTPPYDSEALSHAIGVEPPSEDERHTAMGDAKWCARIWDTLTGEITKAADE